MASVVIQDPGGLVAEIGYSIVSGEPHTVTIGDQVHLDRWPDGRKPVEQEGWQNTLVQLTQAARLDQRESPPAFVCWMREQGLLKS